MLRRPRRLRSSKAIRNLVRETKLQVEDLIYPLFIGLEKAGHPHPESNLSFEENKGFPETIST